MTVGCGVLLQLPQGGKLCLSQLKLRIQHVPFALKVCLLLRLRVVKDNKQKIENRNCRRHKLYGPFGSAVKHIGVNGGRIIEQIIKERYSA